MAFVTFPEPADLEVPFQQRIGDSKSYNVGKYSVETPHPGYGKDPNIKNEFGHTVYPKYVKNAEGKDVIVNSQDEEDLVTGNVKEEVVLLDDGPTVEEWVAAGYKAANYPPNGYASKSSQEEIDAAIAAEKAAHTWPVK